MSVILLVSIIMVMSIITFFSTNKKERPPSHGVFEGKELANLYEYRCFLSMTRQTIMLLQTKLAAVDYNSLQYETFFSPFEIDILREEITKQIDDLEVLVLVQSISADDFHLKTKELQKRINLLTLPLSSLHGNADGYYEAGHVA
jgi:hypothetical protein